MRTLREYLKIAVDRNASGLFIIAGKPIALKINGEIQDLENETRIMPDDSEKLIREVYNLAGRKLQDTLDTNIDEDFSFSVPRLSRFRVNVFKQRGSLASVIKVIQFGIPQWKEIGITEDVMKIAKLTSGLALVTGPAGCGKSTTLACLVDEINRTRNQHIVTLEDPIEFLHKNQMGIVSQREIYSDTYSYTAALRACLRQAADIIVISEIRDVDTLKNVLIAVETGHLVISTLHTPTVSSTISRLVHMFPSDEQEEAKIGISQVLQMIVSQQLLSTQQGKLYPVFEIMTECTEEIRDLILSDKIKQIDSVIRKPENSMVYMDRSIYGLYKKGIISSLEAVNHAVERGKMKELLNHPMERGKA